MSDGGVRAWLSCLATAAFLSDPTTVLAARAPSAERGVDLDQGRFRSGARRRGPTAQLSRSNCRDGGGQEVLTADGGRGGSSRATVMAASIGWRLPPIRRRVPDGDGKSVGMHARGLTPRGTRGRIEDL